MAAPSPLFSLVEAKSEHQKERKKEKRKRKGDQRMKMFSSKSFRQKKLVVCFAVVALVLFVSSVTAMALMERPPRKLTPSESEEVCEPYESCYYKRGCYYCYICVCDEDGESFCYEVEICEDALEKAMGDSIDKTGR